MPEAARELEIDLARLVGCESALLGSSTLHVFWDLPALLPAHPLLLVDGGVYPIGRWGCERAAAMGIPARVFRHYDPEALARILRASGGRRTPVVVADGFCPVCGVPAPLAALLDCIEPYGGHLILDDTQSLGIWGLDPVPAMPYGRGGGGSLRRCGIEHGRITLVSSLAKGFGVPVAMLAGSRGITRRFQAASLTRVHCSPPSFAVLHGARAALEANCQFGEVLRARLAQRVIAFRQRLADLGLAAEGGLFPVQGLTLVPSVDPVRVHARLLGQGVTAVLARGHRGTRLSFLITARHRRDDLDQAAAALGVALWPYPGGRPRPQAIRTGLAARPWPAHRIGHPTQIGGIDRGAQLGPQLDAGIGARRDR